MQRFVALLIIGLALLASRVSWAAAEETFRLVDARGDDFGGGDLVYPNRDDFQPGSLDLQWLTARASDGGTWFCAAMGREIANPHGRVTDLGGQALETLARHDFYTFNLDIYIDTDQVPGSGMTSTLPGRVVDVQWENAWEKAVVLTPRPEVARAWYALHLGRLREAELRAEKGKVEREDLAAIDTEIEHEIERYFYFPEHIQVRGREVEFFVPDTFLGGGARRDWVYTVLVTGADVEQAGRLLNFSPGGFSLMAMSVAPGRAADRLGIINRGDVNQPPVVDLLAPDIESQKRMLSNYDVVAPRFAAVSGMSPTGKPLLAAHPRSGPVSSVTIEDVPIRSTATTSVAPVESAPPVADGNVSVRLKTLNTLRDSGLISEDEYRQLRRKILSEI